MQRINRSAHAPVGTALFLFVGLAIIPVSLRAAGFQINFAPRLTAANDAWQQVAEVFGASYRPSIAPDLIVVNHDTNPSSQVDSAEGSGVLACSNKAEESVWGRREVSERPSLKATPVRRAKCASPRSIPEGQDEMVTAPVVINASFEKIVPTVSALGALKVASLNRRELLKGIDKRLLQVQFQPQVELRTLPGSSEFQVLVRVKKAVAGSTTKAAERKVFTSMSSSRRLECDRAMLTRALSQSPEYGEF